LDIQTDTQLGEPSSKYLEIPIKEKEYHPSNVPHGKKWIQDFSSKQMIDFA